MDPNAFEKMQDSTCIKTNPIYVHRLHLPKASSNPSSNPNFTLTIRLIPQASSNPSPSSNPKFMLTLRLTLVVFIVFIFLIPIFFLIFLIPIFYCLHLPNSCFYHLHFPDSYFLSFHLHNSCFIFIGCKW